MKQCPNKHLESLDQIYEFSFQKIIEILYRGRFIRLKLKKTAIQTLELQHIDQQLKQSLTSNICSSTSVLLKVNLIIEEQNEKEFKKCIIAKRHNQQSGMLFERLIFASLV